MATWDKQSNEYNLHMSVNILYRVLIFTGSGFPNGKMKLLVGKFLVKLPILVTMHWRCSVL